MKKCVKKLIALIMTASLLISPALFASAAESGPAIEITNYKAYHKAEYRTRIVLRAEVTNPVESGKIEWFINGESAGSGETLEFMLKEYSSVYAVYSYGGQESVKSQSEDFELIDSGFFAKIISFIRSVFGLIPPYEQ